MPVLTEEQIKGGYFDIIGGFPTLSKQRALGDESTYINYAREVKDYKGQPKLCICCTQLNDNIYSTRDKKRILNEWIEFLKTETQTFTALHFNSHTPQALFDAACHQEHLVELRTKWGNYKDLSALENLHSLKFLYIGSGPGVLSIDPISKMKSLVSVVVENFKKIEDYSLLSELDALEQLQIGSGILQRIKVNDLEFLHEMPNLLSFAIGDASFKRKYTQMGLSELFDALPNLRKMFVNGKIFTK